MKRDDDRFEPNYFGNCPKCKGCDGYLNVGRSHFFVCDQCKTYWCAGSNLFSDWRNETEAKWEENNRLLDGYERVEALYLPEANPNYTPPAPSVELGLKEKTLTLTNRQIVEWAYTIKEMFEICNGGFHTYQQADWYGATRYTCSEMLKKHVDAEYLAQHRRLIDFYQLGAGRQSEEGATPNLDHARENDPWPN